MKLIRFLITLLFVGIFITACDTDTTSTGSDFTLQYGVYLTNGKGDLGTLTYIDSKLNISNDIQVLGKAPNDLQIINNDLFVVNSMNNSIQIVGKQTIELGNGVNPMFMASCNNKLYTTSLFGNSIYVTSLSSNNIIKNINIPGGENGTDAILAHEGYIYVNQNNYGGTGSVYSFNAEKIFKINTESDLVVDSVTVGANVHEMLVDDYNRLHVLCKGDYGDEEGSVYIIDLSTFDLVKIVDIESSPGTFELDKNGYVYIAISGMNSDYSGFGKILKYESSTGQIINGITNPIYDSPNSGIMGLVFDNENKMYATVFDENKLLIFDNDKLIKECYTGSGPQSLIFSDMGEIPSLPSDLPFTNYLKYMTSCDTLTFTNSTNRDIKTFVSLDLNLEEPSYEDWKSENIISLVSYLDNDIKIFTKSEGDDEFSTILVKVRATYPLAATSDYTTAISCEDNKIQSWASKVSSYISGDNIDSTFTNPQNALNKAEGNSFDIVCLGDSGSIVLEFDKNIINGEGADFCVFENSFSDSFLEFAYVEVSSDGINFIRFPSAYLGTEVVSPFGGQDTGLSGGLAGKYIQGYGVPFDLEILKYNPQVINNTINLNKIKYVKIIDVVGNGNSYDSFGRVIYDPYPGNGAPGFDLDGIGVINN